ncbi:protein of unknown function [Rhodovastum atsumiense]|nr:protein of unknown function [Rhodovastum atsumiense]
MKPLQYSPILIFAVADLAELFD